MLGPEIVEQLPEWRLEAGLTIEVNNPDLNGDGSLKRRAANPEAPTAGTLKKKEESDSSSTSPSPARVIKAGSQAKKQPMPKEPLVRAAKPKIIMPPPPPGPPPEETTPMPGPPPEEVPIPDVQPPAGPPEEPPPDTLENEETGNISKDISQELMKANRPETWEFPEADDGVSDSMSLMIAPASDKESESTGLSLELVVDTGATGSLVSLQFAEMLAATFPECLEKIDSNDRHKYKVASGQIVITSSRASFKNIPTVGNLTVDVLESATEGRIPNLLGLDWLRSNGAVLDIGRNVLKISSKEIPVKQLANGHLAVNIEF
jgi:predicted aspartyl protease